MNLEKIKNCYIVGKSKEEAIKSNLLYDDIKNAIKAAEILKIEDNNDTWDSYFIFEIKIHNYLELL